ncbi:MAG: hypothetical protein K2H35_01885, partial [Muribaculaceae bacterium]|nr:hypothetical protein [Muribaculaceae bacterium]
TEDGPKLFVSFWVSQTADGTSASSRGATRASGDATESVERNEANLKSVVGLLVDADNNRIMGVASGAKVTIYPDDTGLTSRVVLNMGSANFYEREHKYRLYLVANAASISPTLNASQGKNIGELGNTIMGLSSFKYSALEESTNPGLAMSTVEADALTVKVWLEENGDYSSEEKAYVAEFENSADNDSGKEAILNLTPLYGVLRFADDDYSHYITYKQGDGAAEVEKTEVKVVFKNATVKRAANSAYLMPQGSVSEFSIKSPHSATPSVSVANISVGKGKFAYVPEYIPTITDNKLLYNQVTYLELDGILAVDDKCTEIDGDVKSAITRSATSSAGLPTLYYYDDGKFQSGLTVKSHAGEAGWHAIAYDSTLKGYKVTYRHAIRHDAGEGKNLDDAIYHQLEYGIVRNYLYEISINSVSALPHPFKESDEIESNRKDISLRIVPPAKWTYHRGGSIIEFQ